MREDTIRALLCLPRRTDRDWYLVALGALSSAAAFWIVLAFCLLVSL